MIRLALYHGNSQFWEVDEGIHKFTVMQVHVLADCVWVLVCTSVSLRVTYRTQLLDIGAGLPELRFALSPDNAAPELKNLPLAELFLIQAIQFSLAI